MHICSKSERLVIVFMLEVLCFNFEFGSLTAIIQYYVIILLTFKFD